MACTVCAQMGIKTKTTRKRKKDKQPPDRMFHEMGPYLPTQFYLVLIFKSYILYFQINLWRHWPPYIGIMVTI